jgi:hypothetical protein
MEQTGLTNLFRLIKVCGMEVEGFHMNERVAETRHELSHRFKEEIIVPMIAISNVYDFFVFNNAKKKVRTADGVICEVEGFEERHICELEEDIKRLYGIDAWSFIKKWYKFDILMTNMMFVRIWLKKYEDSSN